MLAKVYHLVEMPWDESLTYPAKHRDYKQPGFEFF